MTAGALAEAQAVTATAAPLWFLGTLVRPKLTGEHTGGLFALWEGVLPRGAAPPLHSHRQGEAFYTLDGEVTAWRITSAPSPSPHAGRGSSRPPTGRGCPPSAWPRSSASTE